MKKNRVTVCLLLGVMQFMAYSCNKSNSLKDSESEKAAAELSGAKDLKLLSVGVISDWETGDASQWNGIVAKDLSAQFGVGNSSVMPVRQGTYAARFTVRPGDNITGTSGERCEADHFHDAWNNYTQETIGDEFYYGWSTYFPTSWTNPIGWGIIMQFHHSNPINPPIAFNVSNDTIGINFMTGETTIIDATHRNYAYKNWVKFSNTLSKGLWNDFIVRVKFRPDWTGVFEVWHRVQGQAEFTKVVSLTNIPTMQWSYNADLFDPNFEIVYNGNWYTSPVWLRNGLYRGSGGTNTNTLFHDNFARGTTYADLRARF